MPSKLRLGPSLRAVLLPTLLVSAITNPQAAFAAEDHVVAQTATSNTIDNGDGTFTTRTFADPVNYQEQDGDWTTIDSTLRSGGDGTVHPKAVDGDVSIPDTLTEPVSIEHDGKALSFRLLAADGDRETAGTTATFDDAVPHADVTYRARPFGLKETIELESAAARRVYRYAVSSDADLSAAVEAGGDIVLRDAHGIEAFRIAAPAMWDSAADRSYSNDLNLSVSKTSAGHWTVTMTPDAAWLDDASRVFPVTLDPDWYWLGAVGTTERFHGASRDCTPSATQAGQYDCKTRDCELAGGRQAGESHCTLPFMQVGYSRSQTNGDRPYNSLMGWDLSRAIPPYATATAAQVALWQFSSSQKAPIDARLRTVSSDWNDTATWDVKSGDSPNVPWSTKGGDVFADSAGMTGPPTTIGASGNWSYFTAPLTAVNGWIKKSLPNYGFQLKTDTIPTQSSAYGFTTTEGDQAFWPALDVTWKPDTTAPTGVVPASGGTVSDDQSYVGGAVSTTLNASAQDPESGVAKLELLRDGGTVVAIGVAGCGNYLSNCPTSYNTNLGVNTSNWSEGAHTLYLRATNAAGLVTTTSAWTIYVDRSAPALTEAISAERDDVGVIVAWTSDDPDLPAGIAGSGEQETQIRTRSTGAAWGTWQVADGESLEIVTAATSLDVELRIVDRVGNAAGPVATIAVGPAPQLDPGVEPNAELSAAALDCGDDCGVDDDATQSAISASAVPSTIWGLAGADTPFYRGRVSKPFIADSNLNGVAQAVRYLVPWNITERQGSGYKFQQRLNALDDSMAAAEAADVPVMITFEAGCTSNIRAVSCNNDSNELVFTRPSGNKLNAVAGDLKARYHGNLQWFGVWNEPFNTNQPFRNNRLELQSITRRLARGKSGSDRKNWGVCAVRHCEIVSAEVSVPGTGADPYVKFAAAARKSLPKLKYYGAHIYTDIASGEETSGKSASSTKLAKWMKALAPNSRVWLPEVGVFRRDDNGVEYDITKMRRGGDFLFDKLAGYRTSNGSRIARANYYQACPALETGFDTSIFNPWNDIYKGDNPPSPKPETCASGLTPRSAVWQHLLNAN